MKFMVPHRQNSTNRYLLRGDSEGYVHIWNTPNVTNAELQNIRADDPMRMKATVVTSLTEAWDSMNPSPVGILDQLEKRDHYCKSTLKVCAFAGDYRN